MSAACLIFVKVPEMSHFFPFHFIQIESILKAILSMQNMCDMLGGKTSAVTEKRYALNLIKILYSDIYA